MSTMCEYCGCQETEAIDLLTREHDAVVTLVGDARRALDRGDHTVVPDLCRSMLDLLGPHTAVEEGGLFPPLEETFGEHIRTLHEEHVLIDGVLSAAAAGGPLDGTRLRDVLHLLREHILREQDGVFPAAMTILDREDWDRIGEVRASVGTGLAS